MKRSPGDRSLRGPPLPNADSPLPPSLLLPNAQDYSVDIRCHSVGARQSLSCRSEARKVTVGTSHPSPPTGSSLASPGRLNLARTELRAQDTPSFGVHSYLGGSRFRFSGETVHGPGKYTGRRASPTRGPPLEHDPDLPARLQRAAQTRIGFLRTRDLSRPFRVGYCCPQEPIN